MCPAKVTQECTDKMCPNYARQFLTLASLKIGAVQWQWPSSVILDTHAFSIYHYTII